MRLEKKDKFNILYADEGKHIRMTSDNYKEAYIDEEGNKVEEYFPNFFEKAYVPKKVNEDNMEILYIEEDKEV
jgi:hypothetical protein